VLTTATLAELIGSSVATSQATSVPGVDQVAKLDMPHPRVADATARPVTMRRICELWTA
jgi:hypothetical protein